MDKRLIDLVIANSGVYPPLVQAVLTQHNSCPVVCDLEENLPVVAADLVDEENPWQHNRSKLKAVLTDVLKNGQEGKK